MKLFLAAISIIAAIHYGHALDAKSSACDVSTRFEDAMDITRDMDCDLELTDPNGIKEFNHQVSKACLCFQRV